MESPTKFYLAARLTDAVLMQSHAEDLVRLGHTVTSRWIYGDATTDPRALALRDLCDIASAKILIEFPTRSENRGHFWEAGYAYGLRKTLWTVGEPVCVFDHLSHRNFSTWETLLNTIRKNTDGKTDNQAA